MGIKSDINCQERLSLHNLFLLPGSGKKSDWRNDPKSHAITPFTVPNDFLTCFYIATNLVTLNNLISLPSVIIV